MNISRNLNTLLKPTYVKHFTLTSRTMANILKNRLAGKVAIVTASTDGIGYALAQRLGQEGAKVIISSRKKNNVDSAVEKLKSQGLDVTGLVCHVSNKEHREKLFEQASQLGGLDILVSNAAANPAVSSVLDAEESVWDKSFDINVKAAYLLAKEALPLLRKSQSGRIIFISSICGYQPADLLGVYSVTKTALFGLTKAASLQLAKENITVNCVAPGFVPSKFSSSLVGNEAVRNEILKQIPMGRLGKGEEIAGAVAFLASEDASYVTGETLVVAGGMLSRL